MGLGKKDIIIDISAKTQTPIIESKAIFDTFISILKNNIRNLKISKFGTFNLKKTPRRIGRNPKSLEVYEIPTKERISFKASNVIRKKIN